MKKNLNSVAGYATVAVKTILVMVSVLFLNINFTSCSTGIEDVVTKVEGCDDCPDVNPDPEKSVDYIDHYGCNLTFMEDCWSAKNATITRSAEYSVAASDGGIFNDATMNYLADIVYTDKSTQKANAEYDVRSSFVGFGYKNTLFVAAGEAASFYKDPTIESINTNNGVVTFVKWERKALAFLANTFNSVKTLTIGGKTMSDLCNASVEYTYTHSELIADGDSANYNMYDLKVYGDAKVSYSGDTSTKSFYIIQRIAEIKDSGVTPPTPSNPEVVDYRIVNERINDNGNYTGDLEEILSDGSSNKIGTISFTYQYSFENESPKTVTVNELTYTKLSPSYGENIRTGEVRNFNQFDCNISLTGMKNIAVMRINRGSLTFTGYWEYPILIAPNGKEIELLHNVAEVTANTISDNGVQGNQMVVTMTANGNFGSAAQKNLSSTITLVKSNHGGSGDSYQTGAYAKDQRIEGEYIKWTLVRTFSNKDNTETAMQIAHKYNLSTESRKNTQYRTYNATTPEMNLISSSSFSEGSYSGTFKKYTSTFVYTDFINTISSEGRTSISYKDGDFDVDVWSTNLLVERQGVTFGKNNVSTDENVESYIDIINYTLFAGNTGVRSGNQEVEYKKTVEKQDIVTKGVTKGKVTEDGKLHYTYWIKHSEKPELNSEKEYTLDLQGVITSKAIAGWTTTAEKAGLSLTTPTLSYTAAMDYNYGSNRGNVEAYASMVESFTVTHDGVDYQLSVNGTVNGSVTRTSSGSMQNIYRVTSELKADGVVIARDSAEAIETIEEVVVDEVSYDVKKVGVKNGKLYYNEITRHSVNTELNTTIEKSIPLEYSINATAVNDWTAKEGATGISLNSTSQNYSGSKDYIFGSNRGNNTVNASLKTSYTVSFMDKSYTLTVDGTVTGHITRTGSTSTTNTYTFTGKLMADGVEVAADSDNCVETVEPSEVDEVSYSVEKKGVSGGKLYYYEIEKHSLNTEQNSKIEKSIPLVYSITATACADWTAIESAAGINLSSTSQNYGSAKDYIFGSNRGNHTVNASLQTSYTVSFHGKDYTLTITGKVSASISRTAYTSTTNTYTFVGMLLADNVQIASDNDNCVETLEKAETDNVTYSVEKVGVENGKLYYNEIENHSLYPEQNKITKKSVALVYSINATAVNDWTALEGATGISLTNSSQNYSGAKDYTFASNRGNNLVKTSLQTSYTVTYMGKTYTLTISGTVNASVNLTGSTSTTNTYTFTGKLMADGVEVASDSDNCVETVEKAEKDEVFYSVEKKGVSGNKLYYYEIEKHSLNTEQNSKVERNIPLEYSINTTACADWTAKEGAAGIALTSTSQNYSSAKDYIFASNRGDNKVNASLKTSYTVNFHGKDYTLTIMGKVAASISRTAYNATTNTYTLVGMLLADNVQIASDSDTCVETVEKKETDKVTYSVEKTGVKDGKLHYNEIETHTVNSDQNKTTPKSVALVYSLNVNATADWEAEEGATGISLTSSSQNYNGARDYTFGSNRGNNTATASLQTSYVVSYGGQNHTITVNGTVNGKIDRTSYTSTTNTYTFTGTLLADGIALTSKTDNCVETVKAKIDLSYFGIASIHSAVTFDAAGKPYVTFAAVYKNGNCIVKNANNVEVARGKAPSGTVTEMGGVPVSIQDMGEYYKYTTINGNVLGEVPMTEIVINKFPNGILSADTEVNESRVSASNKYGSATFGNY